MTGIVLACMSVALLLQAVALEIFRRRLAEHDLLLLDLKYELATQNHPARKALQAQWLEGGETL